MEPHVFAIRAFAVCLVLTLTVGGSNAFAATDEEQANGFYENAVVRFEAGDHAGAIIQLKNALQAFPKHRPAQTLIARSYLAIGEPGAAESHLINARELGTDEALIVLPLAESYLAQRKFKEVIIGLRYSGYAPDIEYRLRTYQGRAHTKLGELEKAVRAYRDAQRLDPMAPEPLAGEAMVLLLQGTVELARTKARVATERAPNSPEAWQAMGSINHAMGDEDAALADYGRVIEMDENNLDARVARASIYLDRTDLCPPGGWRHRTCCDYVGIGARRGPGSVARRPGVGPPSSSAWKRG
jgi:tetratricopeptide (TPR) repeat protein